MNVTLRIILMMLFIFQLSCQKNSHETNEIRYFSQLTGIISPYFDYQPRGEINRSEASNMNHYRVIYDTENKISELSYYKGENKSNESYFRTHTVKYNYRDKKLERTYYNLEGEKAFMWRHYYMGGPIHKEVFALSNDGRKASLIFEDTVGNQAVTTLGTALITWETLNERTFIQAQFKLDGSPNLLTEYFPFYKSRITANKRNHLLLIENVNEDGLLSMSDSAGYARVKFVFDEFGNEMSWEFQDVDGNLVNRVPFRKMDHGYAKWTYQKYWKNRMLGLVDSVSEKYFGANSNPIENNFSIHETFYKMTKGGDLKSIEYYGQNKEPRMHPQQGFFRMSFQYDSKGKRSVVQRFDVEGAEIE
ncbi:hypothetical protein [Ekhidna sp.]|uniref:hypothetical protein n=1 Tax=Ekhidna sp. TaxID=2608089 RepID=UPI0032975198